MSTTLSRLECADVLRNCGPDLDPEVREKLEAGAHYEAKDIRARTPTHAPQTLTAAAVVQSEFTGDYPKLELTEKMIKQGWTQADVDTVDEQRRITYEQHRKLGQSPAWMSLFTPELTPGADVEHTPIGKVNRAGDSCVSLDSNGFSVFVCKEGHGYVDNQPGMRGCPQCYLLGEQTGDQPQGEQHDKDAIPGEDSRW